MGGGDLNLKKSWHPQTMKNQEKVWKAEQAKSQEDKKLKDLRREIEEEKSREELKQIGRNSGILPQEDKKLEWMYKTSTELINREEYLLGRTIDKSFETLQAEEQRKDQNMVGVKQSINHVEHECIPFSIRAYRNMESTEQVDLQRKVMEDPLMLIKQREMESRKKILENPVKLKELHRILKTDQLLKNSKKVKKSKKAKKSKKKHKKRSKSSTYEDSFDSVSDNDIGKDLDEELAKRYKKLNKEDFSGLNLSKLLDAKFETITKELDKAAGSKHKKNHRSRSSSSDGDSVDNGKERLKSSKRRAEESYKGETRKQQRRPPSKSLHNNNRRRSRSRSPKNYKQQRARASPPVDRRKKQYTNSRSRSPNNNRRRQRSTTRSNSMDYQRRQSSTVRSPAEPRTRQYSTSPSVEKEVNKASENQRTSKSNYTNNSITMDRSDEPGSKSTDRGYRKRERQHRNSSRSRSKSPKGIKSRRRSLTRSPRKRYPSRSPRKRSPHRHESSGNRNENERRLAPSAESKSKAVQKKLSDTEKEARLREMMENASWREEDRVKSVKKHREENAREEEQYKTQEFDKEFINKEVEKAIANHSSVGSRIRSNLNNIQRTSAAMNSNFTRK